MGGALGSLAYILGGGFLLILIVLVLVLACLCRLIKSVEGISFEDTAR
jgi:hypothetical protein